MEAHIRGAASDPRAPPYSSAFLDLGRHLQRCPRAASGVPFTQHPDDVFERSGGDIGRSFKTVFRIAEIGRPCSLTPSIPGIRG